MGKPKETWFDDEKDLNWSVGLKVSEGIREGVVVLTFGQESSFLSPEAVGNVENWLTDYRIWRDEQCN